MASNVLEAIHMHRSEEDTVVSKTYSPKVLTLNPDIIYNHCLINNPGATIQSHPVIQ